MAGTVDKRLEELGITIPAAAAPAANYLPYVVSGNLVFVSGQVPFKDGKVAFSGKVGGERDLDYGVEAARLCGLNCIAQIRQACGGDLDRVRRIVRVGVFVASAPGFNDQPKVGNGVSDMLVDIFGDRGRHARAAVGVNELPLDVTCEVEMIAEIA